MNVNWLLAKPVAAVCPLCTLAVGAGLGLSRALGIDDLVTSVWLGGLILSSGMWLGNWLTNKKIFPGLATPLAIIGMYLLTILPLFWSGIIGLPLNTWLGVDKVVMGIIIGSVLFMAGVATDQWLREQHQQKVYFPFQKVVLPVGWMVLGSGLFWLITR